MSPQCLPPSFSLIRLTVPEQISFQDFQAGHHGGNLGYWNGTNLAILNLHGSPNPPTKVGLNPIYRSGADRFEDFQDGHPGYQKWTILAILNLYVAPMPPRLAILDIGMEGF